MFCHAFAAEKKDRRFVNFGFLIFKFDFIFLFRYSLLFFSFSFVFYHFRFVIFSITARCEPHYRIYARWLPQSSVSSFSKMYTRSNRGFLQLLPQLKSTFFHSIILSDQRIFDRRRNEQGRETTDGWDSFFDSFFFFFNVLTIGERCVYV